MGYSKAEYCAEADVRYNCEVPCRKVVEWDGLVVIEKRVYYLQLSMNENWTDRDSRSLLQL